MYGVGNYRFIMRNAPNEGKPKDKLEDGYNGKSSSAGDSGMAGGIQLAEQATIETDSLFEGIGYSRSLSRARFRELCIDYFCDSMGLWRRTTVPGTNRSINPDEAVGYEAQYSAQSSG